MIENDICTNYDIFSKFTEQVKNRMIEMGFGIRYGLCRDAVYYLVKLLNDNGLNAYACEGSCNNILHQWVEDEEGNIYDPTAEQMKSDKLNYDIYERIYYTPDYHVIDNHIFNNEWRFILDGCVCGEIKVRRNGITTLYGGFYDDYVCIKCNKHIKYLSVKKIP